MDHIEQNKSLVGRYPFLLPRNVWTDEVSKDYDYSYIRGIGEIPDGWEKLFLQMCEDIRQPLIDADYLEKFRFSQIKEKYNSMRCYHFGAPQEVEDILSKYEMMAGYVCTRCGKPAVYESKGYIASYCADCWQKVGKYERGEPIEFRTDYTVTGFKSGEKYTKTVSFEEEWSRYLELIEEGGASDA